MYAHVYSYNWWQFCVLEHTFQVSLLESVFLTCHFRLICHSGNLCAAIFTFQSFADTKIGINNQFFFLSVMHNNKWRWSPQVDSCHPFTRRGAVWWWVFLPWSLSLGGGKPHTYYLCKGHGGGGSPPHLCRGEHRRGASPTPPVDWWRSGDHPLMEANIQRLLFMFHYFNFHFL